MNGRSGVRIIFPFFLNVNPLMFWVVFGSEAFCASSRRVCSPSPLTTMSTAFSSLRISWSMKVACGPPKITLALGHASFAVWADWRADGVVGVVEVMPIKVGLKAASSFFNSSWSILQAGQSIIFTS